MGVYGNPNGFSNFFLESPGEENVLWINLKHAVLPGYVKLD